MIVADRGAARMASKSENRVTVRAALPRALAAAALLLAASLTPGLASAGCACGFADGKFTLATETIDGTFSGSSSSWDEVQADLDNNVCDAPPGTDLDAADINSDARNIIWFAYTWDATYIYFYTQRVGASGIQRFIYYADEDFDGYMEDGENAIAVTWSNSGITLQRFTYDAVNNTIGDITSTGGVADGHELPGSFLTGSDLTLVYGSAGATGNQSGSGAELEFRVSWDHLTGDSDGVAETTDLSTVQFHVSSMNSSFNPGSAPPANLQDDLSGCGGTVGTTQFADVAVTTPNTITEPHDTLTCSRMTVTNNGNTNDSFELTNSIGTFSGSGGGSPTISYFFDTNSNNVYDAGTDLAVTDTTGASTIDTGTIGILATRHIFVCSLATSVNSYTPSGSATVTTTYTSNFNNSVAATNTTTVTVLLLPNITLTKTSVAYSDPNNGLVDPKRIPGGFVDYTITATNTGGGALTNNTTVITDPIPANTDLYVNSLGGSPANSPVIQTDGTPACGLTLSFSAAGTQTLRLADQTDGVNFSTTASPPYTYNASPTADGNGVSSAVTALRIAPTGTFAGASAAGNPSCSWTFRVRVE